MTDIETSDYYQALENYLVIADNEPNHPNVNLSIANIYVALELNHLALHYFQKQNEINDQMLATIKNNQLQVQALYDQKPLEDKVQDIITSAEISMLMNDYQEAAKELKEGLKLDPSNPQLLVMEMKTNYFDNQQTIDMLNNLEQSVKKYMTVSTFLKTKRPLIPENAEQTLPTKKRQTLPTESLLKTNKKKRLSKTAKETVSPIQQTSEIMISITKNT